MRLQFDTNNTDEDEGLSDAGIETFKGDPISSVARETAQNSRDAAVQFPVTMAFDVISIPSSEFPDVDRFRAHIAACDAKARAGNDLKTKQFFDRAKKGINEKTLKGLRISDHGTTGLIGPCVSGKPFHSLVKSSGVTNKNDPTSGGSFGIGKNATFAVSDFHTVFYATQFVDNSPPQYLAQGKCKLINHALANENLRATGYWGRAGYKPVDKESEAPAWLVRKEVGTTSISVGFSTPNGWQYKIVESLIRNFFAATHRGQLEFFVDDNKLHIANTNLSTLFDDPKVVAAADSQNSLDDLRFSKQLYDCLLSASATELKFADRLIGSFVLRLQVAEGLPQRVAMIRNGMLITSQYPHFKDKLLSFPMYKDFVAILEPSDDTASALIKRLENPQHNELSVDRLIDEGEKRSVRLSIEKLIKWVRDSIRAEAFTRPADEVSLDEMNEFFGDVTNADRIPAPGDDTNPLALTYTPTKTRREALSDGGHGDDEDAGGGGDNESDGGGDSGSGDGIGGGTGGSGGGDPLSFEDFRNVFDARDPGSQRSLFFTPTESGRARLSVLAKGMQTDVTLPRSSFKDANGNPITSVKLRKGVRTRVTVHFATPYRGPISIRLYKVDEAQNEVA